MTMRTDVSAALLRPDNRALIAAVCGAQLIVVAIPLMWSIQLSWMASAGVVLLAAMLFSAKRTLAVMLLTTIALPDPVYKSFVFPVGLRLAEVLLIAAFLFVVIDVFYRRQLQIKRSSADGLVLAFLGVTAVSAAIGWFYGHDESTILRNVRFPLYHAVLFVVVQAVDERAVVRIFTPIVVLAATIVAAGYILEFLGAIDFSTGERFFRVARRQGIMLPVALLLLVSQLLFDPKRYGRFLLLALFVPIGLALALTLGRAMWVAFAVGLVATMWLRYGSRTGAAVSRVRGRLWRGILLVALTLAFLVSTVLLFQRFTGTAITAHAVERSRTFVDYGRDVQVVGRLLGYSEALAAIGEHPILGNGQGKTLTFYSFSPDTDRFETWTSWTLDSLYLSLWLKMGLPGLLLFMWLCLHITRRARTAFDDSDDNQIRAFAAGMVAILLAMLTLGISDGSMVNGRFAAVFGILFGLVVVTAGAVETPRRGSSAPAAVGR